MKTLETILLEFSEHLETLKELRKSMLAYGIDLQPFDVAMFLLQKAHENYEIDYLDEDNNTREGVN